MNAEFLEAGDKDQATEIAEIQAAALRIAGVVKRMARTALSDRAPRPLRVHFKAAPRLFRQAAAAFYRRVDVLGEESLEYVAGGRMP